MHHIREIVDKLRAAANEDTLFQCLTRMGNELGLDWSVAFPDIYDLDRADSLRCEKRSNLPDEFFEEVHRGRVYLNNTPPIWSMRQPTIVTVSNEEEVSGDSADAHRIRSQRKIFAWMQELDVDLMLMVAVHQPLGKTGLVLWSGNTDGPTIEKTVAEFRYELQAFGDIFMSKLEELHGDPSPSQKFPLLSKRELECIRLIANGYSMSEISKALDVSSNTVRYHLDNCRNKLEAKTVTHAVALCAQYGLLGRIGNRAQ